MERKILFFDIDYTLADHGIIPESALKAIKLAQNNGHYCIINTGRPYSTINQSIKDLDFDGYICGCGSYIVFKNEVIYHNQLDETIQRKVQLQLAKLPVEPVFEGSKATYFMKDCHYKYIEAMKHEYTREGFNIIAYNEDTICCYDKMTVFFNPDYDQTELRKVLLPYFDIIDREDNFIEAPAKGHTKATGIQYLIDYLHISHEDTISFGDSTNDLAMLKYTKESVAMGNSNPVIFPYCTYKTTDIDDDGIYNAMKHFHLI